ncbi:hypothetical protein [Noviherbaspirillum cavernae]|uniref:hypothetical protein n=1 Tax=Noviherbaspirillum cavernae TaxID=2320862 RepID=UPI0011C4A989|nr:hypothetical protein [Noviherbaspirillum cavernae]
MKNGKRAEFSPQGFALNKGRLPEWRVRNCLAQSPSRGYRAANQCQRPACPQFLQAFRQILKNGVERLLIRITLQCDERDGTGKTLQSGCMLDDCVFAKA